MDKEFYMRFICDNGLYEKFKEFSTTHPNIKSKKRMAYCFLMSLPKGQLYYHMAKVMFLSGCTSESYLNVNRILKTRWAD